MAVRSIIMGIGGLIGLGAWLALMNASGLWRIVHTAFQEQDAPDSQIMLLCFFLSPLICAFGGGAFVMFVGERLRLFPSQEELDVRSKPVSLFSGEETRNRPNEQLPEPVKRMVDEVK